MIHKTNLVMNVALVIMSVFLIYNNNTNDKHALDTCALIKNILDVELNLTNI